MVDARHITPKSIASMIQDAVIRLPDLSLDFTFSIMLGTEYNPSCFLDTVWNNTHNLYWSTYDSTLQQSAAALVDEATMQKGNDDAHGLQLRK